MINPCTGSRWQQQVKEIIDDPAPYTVEIGKYQKYGELLKNSVDNYPPAGKDSVCHEGNGMR